MSTAGIVSETARLRLRAHRDDDLAEMVALIGNWQVARWLSNLPHPYSEADGRSWIVSVQAEHTAGAPRRFAIALRDSGRIIGGVGLDADPGDDADETALGYWLGEPYCGLGDGREAAAGMIDYGFRTLGLASIRAYTDPANARSQRVLLACGLAPAGEIALRKPTRSGATRAPLFRIVSPSR
jgi:RimJ/RimL family protein N-acetyltransferase